MVSKKKKNFLEPKSIAVLVGALGAVAVLALVVFDVELFIEEADVDVGALEVIVNDGDILPKETVTTTTPCTPNEEIPALEEAGGILGVDIFTCDENNVGLINFTEVVSEIADTRESRFQAFLEEIGLASIDSFGVATTVTLTDIAGNEEESSSILAVPLLSFQTPEGFFPTELDVRFFGVIKNPQSVSLNLEGTVDFVIDQEVISTKKLFISGQIRDSNNIPLNVVDIIPPPLGDRPLLFNYQFDEETIVPTEPLLLQFPRGTIYFSGATGNVLVEIPELMEAIEDLKGRIDSGILSSDIIGNFKFSLRQMEILLSELQGTPITSHTFRVVIKDLTGIFVAEGKQEFIDWTGEFIAYELDFEVDKRLATIIDQDNQVISVFKNDSELAVCGSPEVISKKSVNSNRQTFTCTKIVPERGILFDVKIFENIGGNITGKLIGEVLSTDQLACQTVEGLSRSEQYIIQVGNEFFPVESPLSQHIFNVKFSTGGGTALIRSIDGGQFRDGTFKGWECVQNDSYELGSSNFGYSFNSRSP